MSDEKLHNGCCGDDTCGCEHDHDNDGCGCGHDHEHAPMIVDLEDENGNVVSCEAIDGFEYKDNDYILVQNPDDGSIYLFKVVGEEGELVVPEEEEFEEVSKYYEQTLELEDEE
jgi:uncharacterized protein YrzB (UPF0473 family)